MIRIIITVSFCLATLASFGQARPATVVPIDSLTKSVQQFINNEQIDSLYNLMGTNLQRQISSEQLKGFMDGLVGQLGKWVSFKQTGSANGITQYTAIFPLTSLRFSISQDATGKIDQFAFTPDSDDEESN